MTYDDFLNSKAVQACDTGLGQVPDLSECLMDFQRDIVGWALRKGRAAIFADCGMGKTIMQLEWAMRVPGRVLVVAPLAVAKQTVAEGEKFGIACEYAKYPAETDCNIVVTNYERLGNFDADDFAGVVLDESSILKSFTGKIRNETIEKFSHTRFRLACTATPAPNDFMELGNHAQFLSVMTLPEMLSMFFVHDGGETQKWRLKGHAKNDFWRWLCSWAVMVRKPSDLGYDDGDFILPEKTIEHHTIEYVGPTGDYLFAMTAQTLQERLAARRSTVAKRAEKVAELVNDSNEPWVVWCNLNVEAETVAGMIPDAVNLHGSLPNEAKEKALADFADGSVRVMVTKPKIAGFGMNWQHCRNVAFLGLNDSWEAYYQAVRRCWRFGQKNKVNVHVVTANVEGAVVRNINRKEEAAARMAQEMTANMSDITKNILQGNNTMTTQYKKEESTGETFTAHLGDCIEGVRNLPDNSIGYSIFSPPFASLYTYSASNRDMGNCKNHSEFFEHFRFLVGELLRVTKPGRLLSFHCMNLPTSKARDGVIGITDFRGDLIRMFTDAGWIYHSEVCIWKDPVTAMQRTKALGLLHKTICKDSAMSRQGIPDYVVTMRKPGTNTDMISGPFTKFIGEEDTFKNTGNMSIDVWQRYASPVWMDIRASRTLQKDSARDEKDERHICPLQLDVIERCLALWSKENDLVLSPFMGIGSEGVCAVNMGRRFVGFELKESYYKQAVSNLEKAEIDSRQVDLFNADTVQNEVAL